MVDVSLIASPTVSDCITQMTVSTSANQKGVVGVYTGETGVGFVPASLAEYVQNPDGTVTQEEVVKYFEAQKVYTNGALSNIGTTIPRAKAQ
jgi:hypothetical protein